MEINKSAIISATVCEISKNEYTFSLIEKVQIAILIISALGIVVSLITYCVKHLQLKNQEFKVLVMD